LAIKEEHTQNLETRPFKETVTIRMPDEADRQMEDQLEEEELHQEPTQITMANTATIASNQDIERKNAGNEFKKTNPAGIHKGNCTGQEFT
jgi:hypothetical protein